MPGGGRRKVKWLRPIIWLGTYREPLIWRDVLKEMLDPQLSLPLVRRARTMPDGINSPLAISLTGLAQAALWVAWQMRDRPGADKARKTPSKPATGSDGAADRFCTWGRRAKRLAGSHRAGGVGIKNPSDMTRQHCLIATAQIEVSSRKAMPSSCPRDCALARRRCHRPGREHRMKL